MVLEPALALPRELIKILCSPSCALRLFCEISNKHFTHLTIFHEGLGELDNEQPDWRCLALSVFDPNFGQKVIVEFSIIQCLRTARSY